MEERKRDGKTEGGEEKRKWGGWLGRWMEAKQQLESKVIDLT